MKTPIIPKWKFPAIQVRFTIVISIETAKFKFAKVVDEDSARCKVPGENQRNCHGKDHRTICRFSSPEDVDYRVLRDTLIDWLKDPPSIIDPESVLHMERVSAPTAREDTYNFNASHPRNFIGRDADLEALGKCLETPVRHQMITIWGEGTIGKTSLALQFAHERQDEYRTVALLEASTDLQLRGSIDKFMDYLTRRKDEHLRNLTATLPADQSNATRFREWFEKEVKWLLIIDNIGIDGDDLVPVMKYLPKRGHGHVILICRHPKIAHLLSPKRELRVTRLGDEDAFRLLKGMAGNSAPTDFDESKKLIDTLDGVPGEIDQAGRYLHDHKISLSEYTNRLTALQGLVARTSTQYGSRVAAWRLNFERLESQHKSSMKLFHFLVMLQGSDIPAVL